MLELDDIQYLLLTRVPAVTGRYEFLSFRQPAQGRAWLAAILDKVASARQAKEAIEREHIIAMLCKTRGVVEGPRGAAQLLDMNPSTVRFRMKKLSIGKADYLRD